MSETPPSVEEKVINEHIFTFLIPLSNHWFEPFLYKLEP